MAEINKIFNLKIVGTDDLKRLRNEIFTTEKALKKLKSETKDNGELTKEQSKQFIELETSLKANRKNYRGAQKDLQNLSQAQKKSGSFTMKMAKAFGLAQLAVDGFKMASRALMTQIQDSVKVFADFDIQMQKVKAISGANKEEFEKLQKSAQELGRSTFFTATQVGELQMNFSKLGFTATEVLAAQSAALDMATATGEDLARTATVIGSSIRGFNLDASEAGRVADVMAASFTSSALDLEKFQTSMTKVAPIAELMGVSIEETTAIMGKLSDAGIEASIAGTSLRNIFLKMGDPSSDLAKALGKTIGSGEELVQELKNLRDAGVDVEKMLAVVDQRQVAAFATMVKGVDVIESQILAFENANGAAAEMAGTVGDSLQGAMLRFKSALDGLKIVLVDNIAPALQKTIDSLATMFNIFSKFAEGETVTESFASQLGKIKETDEQIKKSLERYEELAEKQNKSTQEMQNMDIELQNLNRLFGENVTQINEETGALEINRKELFRQIQLRKTLQSETAIQLMAERTDIEKQFENQMDLQKKIQESFAIATHGMTKAEKGLLQAYLDYRGEIPMLHEHSQEMHLAAMNMFDNPNFQKAMFLREELDKMLDEQGGDANTRLAEIDAELNKLGISLEDLNKVYLDSFLGDTGEKPKGGKPVTSEGESGGLTPAELAEIELNQILSNEKLKFAEGIIKTEKELNSELLRLTLEHTDNVLRTTELSVEQRASLETKLADLKAKQRKQDLKETEESEKAKSDLIKANIDNAMTIGSSLTQIGQLMGKNTAAAKAGMAITKAASVASAIKGIIDAKGAITKQAKDGDPFSAFARMAIMAAAVAPLIASLLALKGEAGGSGGAGDVQRASTNAEGTATFARGGLTNGGVFQGASHANGGVKFAVGGRVMEAEGGEAIINKRSTSAFRPILSAINSFNGNGVKFADGGLISSGERFALGGELRSIQNIVSNNAGTSQVIVVESEVTTTQNRVSALESQASF